ncbi:N-acetyl-gamma-glutamyl-phosphate reductase [Candidatus Pelagibacter communis]|uniref:N-acetyl-gamma-glutamyl-phosphate reductase n=1 Tax=Pelagibacter ubique TaxID=198252 RepID=UPI00094D55D5|nr:N-acetyl-gamma-glutamyl-phosphate reductase [Candidatus Pelagibacter ubique]
MNRLNVLVAGSTGYIGIQLVKLLCKHRYIKIKYLCGNSSIGKKIHFYDKELKKYNLPKIIKINYKYFKEVDVIFTALPNGQSQIIANNLDKKNVLIDLSADFRIKKVNIYEKFYKIKHKSKKLLNESVYGLSELNQKLIRDKRVIACPGCYPTSIIIPLFPLFKKRYLKNNNFIIDSKSGYSGAGRSILKKKKDMNLFKTLSAYGISKHRHNAEIDQELSFLSKKIRFNFTPHILPMFRGILSTIYVEKEKTISTEKIVKFLKEFYKKHKFIRINKRNALIGTKNVINTNYCDISVCETRNKNRLVIISTIDNLIKGGAGQAIQNLNIKFGFKIDEGLI